MSDEENPGEIEITHEMIVEALIGETAPVIASLAEHLTEPEVMELANIVVQEQLGAVGQEILPTVLAEGHPKRLTHPTLVMRVHNGQPGDESSIPIDVKAPKSLKGVTDPGVALQSVAMIALLLNPALRGVLKAWGFSYAFAQTTEAPRGSIIVTH